MRVRGRLRNAESSWRIPTPRAPEITMSLTSFRKQFVDIADACALAHAIVDSMREPILVLDKDLRVIAASRSFYSSFKVNPDNTQGRLLYELGDGQWNIPKLRVLLEKI